MFVPVDGFTLRTVAFGPGPKSVLALNGWSASWEAWQPTFEVLSERLRCLSYDNRGTADSKAPASAITFDALVDDVFRVLDAHRVERCVLAGESLGGFIALSAALRHPERFSGLVLVGTPMRITPESTALLVGGARKDYPATIKHFVRACFNEPGTEPLYPWGERLFLGTPPEVAARLFEVAHEVRPDVTRIAVPTVVVHGANDLVVPIAAGRALAAKIPGARLEELPGGCHVPTVTRPEVVAAAIASVA